MYLVVMPMVMQAVPSKEQVGVVIGQALQYGIPVGQLEDGRIQAMKISKEQIKVYNIDSLEVSIDEFKVIKPSSIIRAGAGANAVKS